MQTSIFNQSNPQQETEEIHQPTESPERRSETVKVIVLGSPEAVKAIIYQLYRLGFAEVTAWTPFQKTAKLGEVITLLTRRIWLR